MPWPHLRGQNKDFISLCSQALSCFLPLSEVHPRTPPPPWFCLITGYGGSVVGWQQLRKDDLKQDQIRNKNDQTFLNVSEMDSRSHIFLVTEGWPGLIDVLEYTIWSISEDTGFIHLTTLVYLFKIFFFASPSPLPVILAKMAFGGSFFSSHLKY